MKEELLHRIKSEFLQQKEEVCKHNRKIERINELLEVPEVKEYIQLSDQVKSNEKQVELSVEDMIFKIYNRYLCMIREDETNNIYVYLGTYQYNYDIGVVHSSKDIRVEYNSTNACYREFQDIEQISSISVPIDECEEFEKKHTIIYPKSYLTLKKFYEIQKDFVMALINGNQKSAKAYILTKYNGK